MKRSRDQAEVAFGAWSEQNARYKPANEDAGVAGAVRGAVAGTTARLLAVADGVSGLDAGAKASRLVIRGLVSAMEGVAGGGADELKTKLQATLATLNAEVGALSDRGAGTTLTTLVESSQGWILAHIGDSSAWEIGEDDKGKPASRKLTREHTLVADAERAGVADEEIDGMHQHALQQCMGDANAKFDIQLARPQLRNSWWVVLSDGITDVMGPSELLMLQRASPGRPDKFCRSLCEAALQRTNRQGKPNRDNITAVAAVVSRRGAASSMEWVGSVAPPRRVESSAKSPRNTRRPLAMALAVIGACLALVSFLLSFQFNKESKRSVPLHQSNASTNPPVNVSPVNVSPVNAPPVNERGSDGVPKPTITYLSSSEPIDIQVQNGSPSKEPIVHTVIAGQNLTDIFDLYKDQLGWTDRDKFINEVVRLNDLPSKHLVKEGQKLILRRAQSE